MGLAKVTIEFKGRVEIDVQGWNDDCKLEQIKKQAKDQIRNWTIMIKEGNNEPRTVQFIRGEITEVIIPLKED